MESSLGFSVVNVSGSKFESNTAGGGGSICSKDVVGPYGSVKFLNECLWNGRSSLGKLM